MNQDFDYHEIGKYVNGEMDEPTLKAFQEKMQKNEALEKEVSFYKKVGEVVNIRKLIHGVESKKKQEGFFERYSDLKADKHTNEQNKAIKKKSKFPLRKLIAYAASIIFIAGIGLLLFANSSFSNSTLSRIELSSFMADKNVKNTILQDDVFQKGFDFLNSKNYQEAISFFQKIPPSQTAYSEAQLFLTLALYFNKEYTSAINTGEKLIKDVDDISIKQKTEWILVKSLLAKDDDGKELNEMLDKISRDENHIFQNNAKQLSKKYNSVWRKIVY